MCKTFYFFKNLILAIYQVLFMDAKERYSITEFYLEKYTQKSKINDI